MKSGSRPWLKAIPVPTDEAGSAPDRGQQIDQHDGSIAHADDVHGAHTATTSSPRSAQGALQGAADRGEDPSGPRWQDRRWQDWARQSGFIIPAALWAALYTGLAAALWAALHTGLAAALL
eukprot:12681-Chlamydomonas_euryale.AAC.1